MKVVNYQEIRSRLNLVLEAECPEDKQKILESLDDAIGNNSDELVVD